MFGGPLHELVDGLIMCEGSAFEAQLLEVAPGLTDQRAGRQAEENNHLRQAIMSIRVGKTGYVYVLGARGDEKHRYIISQGGKRDGEDLSQVRDSDGNLIILEQVEKAVAANGEAVRLQYPWKNAGDAEPRVKVVAARYFEPWGWVIGSGTYLMRDRQLPNARTQSAC